MSALIRSFIYACPPLRVDVRGRQPSADGLSSITSSVRDTARLRSRGSGQGFARVPGAIGFHVESSRVAGRECISDIRRHVQSDTLGARSDADARRNAAPGAPWPTLVDYDDRHQLIHVSLYQIMYGVDESAHTYTSLYFRVSLSSLSRIASVREKYSHVDALFSRSRTRPDRTDTDTAPGKGTDRQRPASPPTGGAGFAGTRHRRRGGEWGGQSTRLHALITDAHLLCSSPLRRALCVLMAVAQPAPSAVGAGAGAMAESCCELPSAMPSAGARAWRTRRRRGPAARRACRSPRRRRP